jgi:hypothetical protein
VACLRSAGTPAREQKLGGLLAGGLPRSVTLPMSGLGSGERSADGADRLACPAPWTALGFVNSVERPAHADDLDAFVLQQIASYRAVGHIGLGMH